MNVVIAAASSSGQISGVQRHAINLARCLLKRNEISRVHLVVAPWQRDFIQDSMQSEDARLEVHSVPIGNSALSRNLWFYAQLPRMANQLKADIVHLAYPAPIRRGAFRRPVVVTLHDLYPYDIPENFGFPKVLFNRAALHQCLGQIDAVACVSHSTLSRLKSTYPQLVLKRVQVVCNSVEQAAPAIAETQAEDWERQPFLLCVAQHRRNKNIMLVLRVFERLLHNRQVDPLTRLIVIGIPGPETPSLLQFIAAAGLKQSVILMNGISDARLQRCYRNCSLLLAPSSVEGFGLPVAEALLAGCRVVCSDIPAFRELGGIHCHFVPLGPQEVRAFAEAIRVALGQKPPEPIALPQFSPSVIAEGYLQLYRSLLPLQAVSTVSSPFPAVSAGEIEHLI